MGNPASKSSLQNNTSLNKSVNFVNSSGSIQGKASNPSVTRDSDVFAKFTWSYGGNHVLLTGSFYKWKQTVPLQRQGQQFSITIVIHPYDISNFREDFISTASQLRYKFIVDGEWRFSPQDPYIPDANGNVNNYIDTTNFHHMIDKAKQQLSLPRSKKKQEPSGKEEHTDKQTKFKGVQEFAPTAPKLPPHYGFCSYIKKYQEDQDKDLPHQGQQRIKMEEQGNIFEQRLTEAEILKLFNSSHCLRPPYHVQVDHLIKQTNKKLGSFCITQRFKSKYTTYRYFMTEGNR